MTRTVQFAGLRTAWNPPRLLSYLTTSSRTVKPSEPRERSGRDGLADLESKQRDRGKSTSNHEHPGQNNARCRNLQRLWCDRPDQANKAELGDLASGEHSPCDPEQHDKPPRRHEPNLGGRSRTLAARNIAR